MVKLLLKKRRKNKFPFYKQLDSMDCGPSCLRMIAKFYGKHYSLLTLREKCYLDKEGVNLKGISQGAEEIGMRTLAVKIPFNSEKNTPSLLQAPLPSIAHWNQHHFLVVYKANKKWVWVADPAMGLYKVSVHDFKKGWISEGDRRVLLIAEPMPAFFMEEDEKQSLFGISFLQSYFKPHLKLIFQLLLGMLLGAFFSLMFPFLTQAIVDHGIQRRDVGFVTLILLGQLMVFLGQTSVNFLQNWILLHIGVRLNVNLINDFLIKLMKLPLSFFDTKMTGDLLQRISDHRRIENFLTQSTLSVLFSFINLIVFGIVLAIYSISIFIIFFLGSVFYLTWIIFFLKKRREIDYLSFQQMSRNQDSLIEIIQGMQEIKLSGSQFKRRWKWADIQAQLFRVRIKGLALMQYQDIGGLSINQIKDIFITFLAARLVIEGEMTLGMMLAIQYIIGQLNAPLQRMIGFIREAQDARISLERLNEIHEKKNEEEDFQRTNITPAGDIQLDRLSFRYTPIQDWILDEVNLTIPRGKVTALVGVSGSGKTTLLKLLLGFYQPEKGSIKIGGQNLSSIRQAIWRKNCGVVMQDGYIFSDTIAHNIAESDDHPNYEKILQALDVANIADFVEGLPLGFSTMIGAKGNGISQGQRQRLLIARAIYKDPEFIFMDEATNALDANNEKAIMEKLNNFFHGRTVVVVAHRLSTVKNADQIVVIDQGKVTEKGTHTELVQEKGHYYTLVKNQIELRN